MLQITSMLCAKKKGRLLPKLTNERAVSKFSSHIVVCFLPLLAYAQTTDINTIKSILLEKRPKISDQNRNIRTINRTKVERHCLQFDCSEKRSFHLLACSQSKNRESQDHEPIACSYWRKLVLSVQTICNFNHVMP